jgi:LCP family protein required for cell wall assembly
MVVVLLVAGAFVVANNKFNLIERLGLDTRLDSAAEGAPRNYLVIGSDSRDGLDSDDPTSAVFTGGGATDPSGQRADAIMIMRVDPTAGSVDVVSVPRDLWVPISGTGGEERINTAYSGGPQQMIDTIREDFGIQIHHYMEIDFSGFKDLVDSMGGIPMWFDQPVRDLNSGLDVSDVGCVKLDGYQALAFVRARYFEELGDQGWQSDPTGDLGRMSRQQLFVRRVAQQAATEFSLTDIRGLNSLADVAVDNVTIDARLDLRQMLGLARRFSSVADESLTFHSLPTERWFTPGGADVQLLDPVAAESVLQLFRDEQDSGAAEPPPRLVPIVVLNGSGLEGQATETAVAFEAVGFTVAETGNANGGYATTVVRHGPGAEATALRAARHIAGGAAVESDDGLPPGAVIVVLGSDFTTVLDTPLDPDDPVLAGLPGFAPVTEPQGTSSVAGSDTTTEAAGGQPGGSTGDPDDNAGAVDEDPAPPRPEVPEAVLTPGQPPEGVICT